jgi:Flp pilus assembly protein CpaB
MGRLSTGHWVMLVAGLAAVVLNFAFLRSQDRSVSVAAAAVDLVAGSRFDVTRVTFTPIHAETSIERELISKADLDAVDGMVLAHSVPAGELISRGDLLTGKTGPRAMSIPIDRDHAAGGLLHAGDRVDLITSNDGFASFVLVGAEVLSVSDTSGSLAPGYSVTVALDADSALRVAAAMSDGTLQIVRSTGAPAPTSSVYPDQP